jgi:nucleotide-binding universal stress UspA family protein
MYFPSPLGRSSRPDAGYCLWRRHSGIAKLRIEMRKELSMAGTIMCGVNESAEARHAAGVAAALSKQLELRLLLVHVADGRADAKDLTRLLDRLATEQGLEGVEQRIEVGDTAEGLAQVAAEERAALILVGARPQVHRWRRSFRSNLRDDLARLTVCPVFVVRAATNDLDEAGTPRPFDP